MTCQNCLHLSVCKFANEDISLGTKVKDVVHDCVNFIEEKHGQWIENEDGEIVCTECGVRIPEMYSNADSIMQFECKFCHSCGSKMDLEE